ncbi:MAG: pitrilysin family protein [Bacteroidia bacterium]
MEALGSSVWYHWRPSATSILLLLLWNKGSRHDPPQREGLLHFLEHALFKGTQRRSGRALFRRIERFGGEMNAFTTKDKMGVELRVPPAALPTALATLRELAYEATFPEKEVEKERAVILEEQAMYEDIPEESLLDHFEEQVFAAGGLRHPVTGYAESVRQISAEELRKHYKALQAARWVLVLSGGLPARSVAKAIQQTGWDKAENGPSPLPPTDILASASVEELKRPTQQVHLVVGGVGPSPYALPESLALQLLLHELAGPQMGSRLNLLLRERYGWCYSVYSFWHAYPERSVWGIYAGLTPEAKERARRLIHTELQRWQDRPPSSSQLAQMRRSFWGRQQLATENPTYWISLQAKHLLDQGQLAAPHLWKEALQTLTPQTLGETAQRYLNPLYERIYVPL